MTLSLTELARVGAENHRGASGSSRQPGLFQESHPALEEGCPAPMPRPHAPHPHPRPAEGPGPSEQLGRLRCKGGSGC